MIGCCGKVHRLNFYKIKNIILHDVPLVFKILKTVKKPFENRINI